MSGVLTALAAKGAQDLCLTYNPSTTFWKSCYKRHTNFMTEPIELTFNGSTDFGKKLSTTINRNGDMIHAAWLIVDLSAIVDGRTNASSSNTGIKVVSWTNAIGFAMIETVELVIGGYTYDTHTGEWLLIKEELSTPVGKELGALVGDFDNIPDMVAFARSAQRLYIPLKFWYMLWASYALPLISIQYHEIKLNFKLRSRLDLIVPYADDGAGAQIEVTMATANADGSGITGGAITDAFVLQEYVYLDNKERYMFAAADQKYLIRELQYSGDENISSSPSSTNITLRFNHPILELVWVFQRDSVVIGESAGVGVAAKKEYFNYSSSTNADSFLTATLTLNGNQIMKPRRAAYFRCIQPRRHHTKCPTRYIYTMCFALVPESPEPSNSVNFSRIDDRNMAFTFSSTSELLETSKFRIYADNFNRIKISGGMVGKQYAS